MPKVDETCHGFTLRRSERVEEIDSQALIFQHDATGAELIVLQNTDDNKVFKATFSTPPADHTGVPHILEHSVLNGSHKYPVKEPFAELFKGSLHTYLNASTYPDRTCYPVASRNARDFHNLMDVYLDAIFNPLLSAQTFQQEGWHFELADPDSPLTYSGVVYNEMLGAYSNPDTMLHDLLDKTLFPDSVYGLSSGGDPAYIPDLTYAGFCDFHRRYYHPSNCRLFLHGDVDLDEALAHLQRYLGKYERGQAAPAIVQQPRFPAPKSATGTYPVSAGDEVSGKTYVLRAWGLGPARDQLHRSSLFILAHILSGNPASPLYQALIESGFGEDVINVGLEPDLYDMYYAIGLKGTDSEKLPRIEALIDETLARLAREGIDQKMIEAAINSTEFALREANFGGYPKGLAYGLMMMTSWLYGDDPLAPVRYEPVLAALRTAIAEDGYLERLIETELIQNTHRVTVMLEPDPELEDRRQRECEAKLAKVKDGLNDAELAALVDATAALRAAQLEPDSPEALASMPKLPLDCIDAAEEQVPFELVDQDGPVWSFAEQQTSRITYFQVLFDVAALPQQLLAYLPVFGKVLIEAGTAKRTYVDMIQEIGIHTGGISCGYSASSIMNEREQVRSQFVISGKSLTSKCETMLALIAEMLHTVRLDDVARLREIALKAKSRLQSGVVPAGHRFVARRLGATYSLAGAYQEVTTGISQYQFLTSLVKRLNTEPETVLADLRAIQDCLRRRQAVHLHVTGGAAELDACRRHAPVLLEPLADRPLAPQTYTFTPPPVDEALVVPSNIQYVGKSANLFDHGFTYSGAFDVVETFLSREYLWQTIRVQGNAYGAFADFSPLSGVFTCLSYRDPNIKETIAAYNAIADCLGQLQLPRSDFERLIIGTIGGIDAPLTPDQKGSRALQRYFSGITHEWLQQRRSEVLGSTLEDLTACAAHFRKYAERGTVCAVGNADAIKKDRACFKTVTHVFGRD